MSDLPCHLTKYGGDYAAYIVLGIALNAYLSTSLNSFYNSVCTGYWTNAFDLYATSPVGIRAYLAANILFSYFMATISVGLYLGIGIFFFGIHISPESNLLTAGLGILLGMIAVAGIGLVAASTFTLLNAKNWSNPVTWLITFLVALLSGVYFPPEILPQTVRTISYILPQTYSYDVARMGLLMGAHPTDPTVIGSLIRLVVISCITLPIGIFLFRKAIRKAEKYGTLSRWS